MSDITAAQVKALREATNVSMMECKHALVEAKGDMEKATRLLRERGIAVAAKKASRSANQGVIVSGVTEDGRAASLVEVNCETDFVAKNDIFKAFARCLARRACDMDGSLADEVKEEVTAKITETGENIVVRRNERFVLRGTGGIASYIHLGGKVGALIEVGCEKNDTVETDTFKELIKDLTLHVAACSPRYLTSNEVPGDVIRSEREIYAAQVKNKPPDVVNKIVDGKLQKFFAEVCLEDQEFVKESKQRISALLAAKSKELGDNIIIRRFLRYQLG